MNHNVDDFGRRIWRDEDFQNRYESKLAPRDALKASNEETHVGHRAKLLQKSILAVGKRTVVAGKEVNRTFGKSKRFGFACPVCDQSFRDTLALVDHINSIQHATKARLLARLSSDEHSSVYENGLLHATYLEVCETLESLVAALLKRKSVEDCRLGFQERALKRKDFEEKKVKKRLRTRERFKSPLQEKMGFDSFLSTKA